MGVCGVSSRGVSMCECVVWVCVSMCECVVRECVCVCIYVCGVHECA